MIFKEKEFHSLNGIFYSKNKELISYPTEGNDECYKIEENSFWFQSRNVYIMTALKEFSLANEFIDIGGGNGYQGSMIQESGKKVILIEPGEDGVLNARSRGIDVIICSSLNENEFNESSFKDVGLFDVVEHIEDDNTFVALLNKLMSVGGRVFITVPAYSFLWSDVDHNAGHFRRYTYSSLKKLFEDNGFRTIYGTYIFSYLVIPIFFLRVISNIFKRLLQVDQKINESATRAHSAGKVTKYLIDFFIKVESYSIKHRKFIPFGGSILCVFEK